LQDLKEWIVERQQNSKTLSIAEVIVSVCGMKGQGFCPHEIENGKCNYSGNCTNKQTEL